MNYSDTEQIIEQLLEFPVAQTAVLEQMGAIELTSQSGESMTIREILDPVEEDSYLTADALYAAIVGNLDETFIGRKYYDDRGAAPPGSVDDDEPVVSF